MPDTVDTSARVSVAYLSVEQRFYIVKLIAGVREAAEKDVIKSGLRVYAKEAACRGKFLDAMLLCDVIEEHILHIVRK